MNGIDVIGIATPHVGERYVLGSNVPLNDASYRGPWDCAEFVSWCAYQAYGFVFGAYGTNPATADPYSGKWYEDARDAGTLISVDDALGTPGAYLVRRPGSFGLKIGHIAISLGDGRSVEARSAATGVVIANASGRSWSSGIQLPGVLYNGAAIASAPPAGLLRLTHPFLRGDTVLRVQTALEAAGFSVGGADGVYGPQTASAVANFQRVQGLAVDGEVGPDTAAALGIA